MYLYYFIDVRGSSYRMSSMFKWKESKKLRSVRNNHSSNTLIIHWLRLLRKSKRFFKNDQEMNLFMTKYILLHKHNFLRAHKYYIILAFASHLSRHKFTYFAFKSFFLFSSRMWNIQKILKRYLNSILQQVDA